MSDDRELHLLRDTVDGLHHKLVQRERRDKDAPCEHMTLRPPYLPCPHPDCYSMPTSSLGIIRVMRRRGPVRSVYQYMLSETPNEPFIECEEEAWERSELMGPNDEVWWAWRRLPHFERGSSSRSGGPTVPPAPSP